jgi:environmental stress-induced protein Ves
MHRVLTPADYRQTAWKNGGGRTTEVAVHPPGADFARFAWRASVADVGRDGPFSAFPGVDRTLVLLRGAGITLAGEGEPVAVTARYDPVTFAGDAPLECRLHEGPVRDFNLMVRREFARGELDVVQAEAVVVRPARFRLCYAAAGASECLLAGHVPLTLNEDEALLIDAGDAAAAALHVNPLSSEAVALVATIDMIRELE